MEEEPDNRIRQRRIDLLVSYLALHHLPLPVISEFGMEEAIIVDRQAALELGFSADGKPPLNPNLAKLDDLTDSAIVPLFN